MASSRGMSSTSVSGGSVTLTLSLLLLVSLLLAPHSVIANQNQNCRDYCHNGGTVLMPSTVFGFCRCKCPAAFTGPKCQLRSANGGRRVAPAPPPAVPVGGLSSSYSGSLVDSQEHSQSADDSARHHRPYRKLTRRHSH